MGAAAVPGAIAGTGGIASAFGQYQAGRAQSDYYSYVANTATMNAGLEQAKATAARQQIGAAEAQQDRLLGERIRGTIGAQKVAAVNSVGASSRTAQTLVQDTLNKGNLDEMALRYNADVQAKNALIGAGAASLNDLQQAAGYDIAGANARAAGGLGAMTSLLGSAGSVANSWYMGRLYAGGRGGVSAAPMMAGELGSIGSVG